MLKLRNITCSLAKTTTLVNGYNTIITKTITVDIRFYEYLRENLPTVEQFLAKRRYINLILGIECANFISPARYICYVKGCEKLITLIFQQCVQDYRPHQETVLKEITQRRHIFLINSRGLPSAEEDGSGTMDKTKKKDNARISGRTGEITFHS